jgi:hypothetical protein
MRSSLLALALLAGACANTGRLESLAQLKGDEAIVVGRFKVLYNGKDATQDNWIAFDQPKTGLIHHPYLFDETGYMVTALPVGEHALNLLHVGKLAEHIHWFEPPLTFTVARPGEAYYVGDVTIDWGGAGTAATLAAGFGSVALAGVFGYSGVQYLMRGEVTVSVESKASDAEAALKRKLGGDRSLVPALLGANSPRPEPRD